MPPKFLPTMPGFRLSYAIVAVLCLTFVRRAPSADPPTTQTFDAQGVKIAYYVQGEGEPVVLIHGWLSSASINWDLPGVSKALAKDFRVIALDIRGHGNSDKPTDEKAYGRELVEDVVRLMDHLKIEKAHIVGYSMGGMIAANFVVEHPDRVLSGTLGGMGWFKEGSAAQWFLSQVGKEDKEAKAHAVCGRSLAKLALTEDQIKSIRVPMKVLVGADDRVIKDLYIKPLKEVRPDWSIVEITGGGHFVTLAKEQFRSEIADWLGQNANREKSMTNE